MIDTALAEQAIAYAEAETDVAKLADAVEALRVLRNDDPAWLAGLKKKDLVKVIKACDEAIKSGGGIRLQSMRDLGRLLIARKNGGTP